MDVDNLEEPFNAAVAARSAEATAFEYGQCKTDWKDGKEIRNGNIPGDSFVYRETDYMNDEPYASCVRAMLDQLGLPFPKPEEIFRGTRHDLLFLNSHGVVLRIGPTDVQDLINPGIVQPLGWLEDPGIQVKVARRVKRTVPLSIVIYPGIELFTDWLKGPQDIKAFEKLDELLDATGQTPGDLADPNTGIVRTLDDDNREVAVKMQLDIDNYSNASSPYLAEQRASIMAKAAAFLENKADVLSYTLQNLFATVQDIKYWQRAFETHQPLRRLFWDAFKDIKKPDIASRNLFWESCARVTNNPQSATVPVWRSTTNENGKTVFTREEIRVPQVVLYRPWTGKEADKIIQPIKGAKAITTKHARLMRLKNEQARTLATTPINLSCV